MLQPSHIRDISCKPKPSREKHRPRSSHPMFSRAGADHRQTGIAYLARVWQVHAKSKMKSTTGLPKPSVWGTSTVEGISRGCAAEQPKNPDGTPAERVPGNRSSSSGIARIVSLLRREKDEATANATRTVHDHVSHQSQVANREAFAKPCKYSHEAGEALMSMVNAGSAGFRLRRVLAAAS
jgi:hypothetical protein